MGGGGVLNVARIWETLDKRTRRTQLFFTPGMQCNRTAPQTIISNVIWITSHSHHIISIISTVARDVSIPTLSMNIHGCLKSSSNENQQRYNFHSTAFSNGWRSILSLWHRAREKIKIRSLVYILFSRAGWSISTVPTILCIAIRSGLDCYIAYVLYACVLGSYWLLFKYE